MFNVRCVAALSLRWVAVDARIGMEWDFADASQRKQGLFIAIQST
jgi:hypothetical protein